MSNGAAYGPYDFLDDINPDAHSGEVRPFMLTVCDRLVSRLPAEVLNGLEAARRFQFGSCDATELESARVACWNYLGNRSCEFQDPDVNAVRAVICAMYPDSEDAFHTIHVFLDFVIAAGLAEGDVLGAMRNHFLLARLHDR
jgi:hypothetical protein